MRSTTGSVAVSAARSAAASAVISASSDGRVHDSMIEYLSAADRFAIVKNGMSDAIPVEKLLKGIDLPTLGPLMHVAIYHVGCIRSLVAMGCPVDTQVNSVTPLWRAATEGLCAAAVMLVAAGANPDFVGPDGRTPRSIANESCQTVLTRLGVEMTPDLAIWILMAGVRLHSDE